MTSRSWGIKINFNYQCVGFGGSSVSVHYWYQQIMHHTIIILIHQGSYQYHHTPNCVWIGREKTTYRGINNHRHSHVRGFSIRPSWNFQNDDWLTNFQRYLMNHVSDSNDASLFSHFDSNSDQYIAFVNFIVELTPEFELHSHEWRDNWIVIML